MGGSSGREVLDIDGKAVGVQANPVWVEGSVRGVVLIAIDVTDAQGAEQLRREFSANVSHELKTPLTSISGYAEIMKNGLVRPGDLKDFAGKIYREARRTIDLIDDIIKLSRLDERDKDFEVKPISLYSAAFAVKERLTEKAQSCGVELSVSGESGTIIGNAPIMDEIIFNLCDNAIKYNKPGGSVRIEIRKTEKGALLSVRDTGIGIPKEHQARVFERFYRVDKSHSKETGGTGLGLSIVKHGVILHNANIELVSEVNKGTVVNIQF
jgi:two-component system phosphate regulon sensor histidine kinase PhoR